MRVSDKLTDVLSARGELVAAMEAMLAGAEGEARVLSEIEQKKFDRLKAEVEKGLGDGEVLAWITANASFKREPWEIAQWSAFQEAAAPSNNEGRAWFNDTLNELNAAHRTDILTQFDRLDLDDFVSFGGKA